MSKLDFTPETIISNLENAEQLSLALQMLLDQSVSRESIFPIAEKLNSDLQDVLMLIRLAEHDGKGVWGLPMLSAVSPSPC